MLTKMRWAATAGVLVTSLGSLFLATNWARADDAPRKVYDFEDGAQGFVPLQFKDGSLAADPDSTLTVAKDLVKSGQGSLCYTYKLQPHSFRALATETRLPLACQSVTAWLRSTVRTVLLVSLREEDGSAYELPVYVPANEWVQVTANLDEFRPGGDSTDENQQLNVDQVRQIAVLDIGNLFVNAPAGTVATDLTGERRVFLDDLKFALERLPQASGNVAVGERKARLLDNFESGLVGWLPVRVNLANTPPAFDLFPESARLAVLPEAAGPGPGKTALDPGGKGLRLSYQRGAQDVFALVRSFESQPLPPSADRLHLSINASQKSMLRIQVKERDGSEYQYTITPENSVGWQHLDLPLASLTLDDASSDENQKLDPDQIKEISIVDVSAPAGLGASDVSLDLDAVYFTYQ